MYKKENVQCQRFAWCGDEQTLNYQRICSSLVLQSKNVSSGTKTWKYSLHCGYNQLWLQPFQSPICSFSTYNGLYSCRLQCGTNPFNYIRFTSTITSRSGVCIWAVTWDVWSSDQMWPDVIWLSLRQFSSFFFFFPYMCVFSLIQLRCLLVKCVTWPAILLSPIVSSPPHCSCSPDIVIDLTHSYDKPVYTEC